MWDKYSNTWRNPQLAFQLRLLFLEPAGLVDVWPQTKNHIASGPGYAD